MNSQEATAHNQSVPPASKALAAAGPERFLTLLAEGAALGMPEYEPESYKKFRASISKLALQLSDRLPDDDKLALIRQMIHEFEAHRNISEDTVQERITGWGGWLRCCSAIC